MPALAFALLFAASSAFNSGQVLLKTDQDVWEYQAGWNYTMMSGGCLLLYDCVPYASRHFVIPTPDRVVFENDHSVSFWDGVFRVASSGNKSYADIFQDDLELSDIAPMRSGHFLVAERSADRGRGARLIEFDLNGRIKDHLFPEVLDASGRALGARHIALLADQCTVLYTNGLDDPNGNRVRRMNICTDSAEADFATLIAGQYAAALRQMADRSVIVANGVAIQRFTADGSLMTSYEFAGVTHVALTPDGSAFWAAGVENGAPVLRLFGDGATIPIGNPGMYPPASANQISGLVVVSEFQPALPRRHATR